MLYSCSKCGNLLKHTDEIYRMDVFRFNGKVEKSPFCSYECADAYKAKIANQFDDIAVWQRLQPIGFAKIDLESED